MENEMNFCEYCGKIITSKEDIFLGSCKQCQTHCSSCKCETTGETTYDGLCEDCEEERLEELRDMDEDNEE